MRFYHPEPILSTVSAALGAKERDFTARKSEKIFKKRARESPKLSDFGKISPLFHAFRREKPRFAPFGALFPKIAPLAIYFSLW